MNNTCYLSYLTFDTTSSQSQDPASAKLIAYVALRQTTYWLVHVQAMSPTLFLAFLVFSEPHPSILSLPTSVSASVYFLASKNYSAPSRQGSLWGMCSRAGVYGS